jgi:thiosulfate dehydrogenase [quinone] large subunit
VQAQLAAAQRTSPIGGALSVVAHNAVLFGLLIALGELAVGAATLLGLWTRVAAAGGMALALSFLLTVSWHTSPYYLGADIVFLVAFTPLLIAGPHPWSLDALADRRSRADAGLAVPTPVTIDFDRLRRICGFYADGSCRARADGRCEAAGCPVLDDGRRQVERAVDLPRRRFLETARMAGGLALVGLVGGAATAAVGRMLDVGGGGGAGAASTPGALSKAAGGASSGPAGSTPPTTGSPGSTHATPPGQPIGASQDVPRGSAATFVDPGTGDPAVVIHRSDQTFVAFDTVCPHQGCTVEYDAGADEFQCPCHGARFDGRTGAVLQGPAEQDLRAVPVRLGSDDRLYAV